MLAEVLASMLGCAALWTAWLPMLIRPWPCSCLPVRLLIWKPSDLAQGRRHKDATTSDQILQDVAAAVGWLQRRHAEVQSVLWVSASGGVLPFWRPVFPGVAAAFDCCGAGVSRMRPGGGEPSLALLPQIQARLTYVFGTADPLVPADDRAAIQAALL